MEMRNEKSKQENQYKHHVKNELKIKNNRIQELERATEEGFLNLNDVENELYSLRKKVEDHDAELHI